MDVNPFVKSVQYGQTEKVPFAGGQPQEEKVPFPTCTRDDAEYFLQEAGIDLDTMQQQALLSNLPPGTALEGPEVPHPNIKWQATRTSGLYLFRPDDASFDQAVRTGKDLVVVVAKPEASQIARLSDYHTQIWESVGDLALIWATDRSIKGGGRVAKHHPHFTPANWILLIDLTEQWAPDDRSLAEKIIEDGYVHHLGCSEASPYLTQLETE